MDLWNNETKISFFKETLRSFASPEQLFYYLASGAYAYVPKGVATEGKTLQSRNSLIGNFTEKWCRNIVEPIAKKHGLFAINSAICEEIGLTRQSSADLIISSKDAVKRFCHSQQLL